MLIFVAPQWDRLGEASSLPIQDETVDYASANMYLHHVEVSLQAIIEMVRILKPGDRVVITDLDEHGYEFLRREHNDLWMGSKRGNPKMVGGGKP